MARAEVVHSQDACAIVFKGNPKRPEPSTGIIKFPGGHVEVSRCSDGTYWAHIEVDDVVNIKDSRIDFNYETQKEHLTGIPPIPHQNYIEKIAIRVDGVYKEPGEDQ